MSWCIECGEEGRPEKAVMTVDGDPLCMMHGKARGGKVFQAPGAPAVKAAMPVQTPAVEPAEEKVSMEKCACGCGENASANRKYAWGHKPKTGGVAPKRTPKAARVSPAAPKETVSSAEPGLLDTLWNALPESHQREALRSLLEEVL